MKILLDESLPRKLKADFGSEYEVRTVRDMGWLGKKNGEHSEHIVTGAMVTEILLKEGWVDKYPLYFPVDIKEDVIDDDEISYIDKEYINLKVVFTDEDEQKMIEAANCYETQFTPKEIKELTDLVTKNKVNTKYFRRFIVSQKTRTEFWD